MNPRRVVIVAMLACFASHALGQEKKPTGIDQATVAALEKRGFKVGWMRERDGRVSLTAEYPKAGGSSAIPAVWYLGDRELTDADLKDLPAVAVPFALSLAGRSKMTDEALEHIAGLANLVWLDLGSAPINGQGLKHLARLKQLTTLKLAFTGVSDGTVKYLADFPALTHLSLHITPVSDHAMKTLAGLKTLTVLDLGGTLVTDDGLKILAARSNYTELHLNGTQVGDEGLAHLAGMTELSTLNVWMTEVTGEDLKPLAGMKKLTTLGIENSKVTDRFLESLSAVGLLHAYWRAEVSGADDSAIKDGRRPARPEDVRTFKLNGTRVTGAGLQYLGAFPNLRSLMLDTPQTTSEGLRHVGALKNLNHLWLGSTEKVGDGLKNLAALQKLTFLAVGGTEIARDDLKRVAGIKSLTGLALPVTDESIQWLHEAGMLHLLTRATAVGGKRAARDEEIVSLDLSNAKLQGTGLKSVAKLKNLATLKLTNTPVTDAWVKDFERTRPECKIVK